VKGGTINPQRTIAADANILILILILLPLPGRSGHGWTCCLTRSRMTHFGGNVCVAAVETDFCDGLRFD
jgi:hypothetical protein